MNFTWTEDDVICTDRFLDAFPDNYVKTCCFYLRDSSTWRGKTVTRPPETQRLIIAGHSDYPLTDDIVRRYPNSRFFGVNSQSGRVTGIPLGITNDTNESDLHRIYGNIPMMLGVVKNPRQIKNLAYLNVSVGTYPSERVPVKQMFSNLSWVTQGESVNTMEGRRKFLEEVRNHTFVFCPRGNGIDTHRLWETLYMGSIPIVKRDIAHAGWTDLPILFVDDWSEVTEERLLAEQNRIESTTWNMEKLRVGYWVNLIKKPTMKIGTIVTATDLNPLYSDFIPNFVKAWKAVIPEADIRIVLIAEEIPESLRPWESNLVLFKPIEGIHTAFQAQCIRLLYPREVTRDEGVLITDMDMLPGNRSYYVDSVRSLSSDAFVVYRDVCFPDEIAMCYNVARPAVWGGVFGNEPTDVILRRWYEGTGYDGTHGGVGWGTDQSIFKKMFDAWVGDKIVLNDKITNFTRLDRAEPWNFANRTQLRNTLLIGYFCDYHCLRPYSENKDINDFIVSCLQERTW